MADTTLTMGWASAGRKVEASEDAPRRGFAIGLVVAIPIAALTWYLLFSLI